MIYDYLVIVRMATEYNFNQKTKTHRKYFPASLCLL